MKTVMAWHFTNGMQYRDGRKLVVGEWVEHDGAPVLCNSGLHASIRARDALYYAPGEMVSRVLCAGKIEHGNDKLVCTRRMPLWTFDATETLRLFARLCAKDVLHLWDAPQVVRDYLDTGSEDLRDAARDAAWDAAWAAAWAAASAAARDAARAAASAAARDAAWDAAWAAARDAQNQLLESLLIEDAMDHGIDVEAFQ